MSSLQLFRPAVDSSTPTIPPTAWDDPAWDEVISLPRLETPGKTFLYYFNLAWEGIERGDLSHLDLDLVEWARDGYDRGVEERDAEIAARLLADAPTDGELAAPFDPLPTPAQLAARLRGIDAVAVLGEGPDADFLAAALRSIAADVEIFDARCWEDLEARDYGMAASFGAKGGAL